VSARSARVLLPFGDGKRVTVVLWFVFPQPVRVVPAPDAFVPEQVDRVGNLAGRLGKRAAQNHFVAALLELVVIGIEIIHDDAKELLADMVAGGSEQTRIPGNDAADDEPAVNAVVLPEARPLGRPTRRPREAFATSVIASVIAVAKPETGGKELKADEEALWR
jgi:hypothetical protein